MFQSGKTTFSKTAKAPAIHIPTNPALTKRQQELHKQVSFTYILEEASLRPFGNWFRCRTTELQDTLEN